MTGRSFGGSPEAGQRPFPQDPTACRRREQVVRFHSAREVLRRLHVAPLVDVPPMSSHLGTIARVVGPGRRERRQDAP